MSKDLDFITFCSNVQARDFEKASRLEYQGLIRSHVRTLKDAKPNKFNAHANTPSDILEILDPSTSTIGYLFALLARIEAFGTNWSTPGHVPRDLRPGYPLWNKVIRFLETADPILLRYVGEQYRTLNMHVECIARTLGQPALAIAPLRAGMMRLDTTTGTFTSTHLQIIRLCVETRQYAAAVPILDNYIHSITPTLPANVTNMEYGCLANEHLTSGEYLQLRFGHSDLPLATTLGKVQEYYVLGAMAYIGIHDFKKARDFLEHVLVTPSNQGGTTGLFLEAYKKWVLVSLLVDGSATQTPRTMHPGSLKIVRSASKAYEAVADAFKAGDVKKLRSQIAAGHDTWAEDGNSGLVGQLEQGHYRLYISRLANTYSAIPVSKIVERLGGSTQDAVNYLNTLSKQGHLNAQTEDSGDAKVGVVLRFFPDSEGPLAKTEKQQEQALVAQTQRIQALAEQIRSADFRLGLTKEYVANTKREKEKAATTGDAMDTSWDDGVPEEDILGEG
ncbi:hypothetical protein M011DRAFT_471042 [Sporormia fimetaria CBS 119925]|uniref:COP9 signalosome complex subunit 3 n=1 Tax=Sporormia fimetaria CBS 119925 TaxID=1340428 RepID=A0A6A6V067_9PLEO|nr:hypothetical protein M011DRAFT_471042 [Sporormia fimetaria CBS 119925]